MRKLIAGGLVLIATTWLFVNATIVTAFLPPVGWLEIHSREPIRILQDVEPWISWAGLALFAVIIAAYVTTARRAPVPLRLPRWTFGALVLFLAAVVAFIVSGIWTIDPREAAEIGNAGDVWFHRMRWLNAVSYYLGIWTLATLVAGALTATSTLRDTDTLNVPSSRNEA